MKQYIVKHTDGTTEEFFCLTSAKVAMRQDQGSTGVIYKTWANGDFECLGSINLKGNNKTFAANTRQTTISYN